MIDLDALEASIADGERRNLFVAPLVKDLIAELREARGERAAVVAYLRKQARAPGASPDERTILTWVSNHIDRGEHRREVAP